MDISFVVFLSGDSFRYQLNNMASATILSISGMDSLAINDTRTPSLTMASTNAEDRTVEYWTALIRKNLTTAHEISLTDSDAEDTSTLSIDEEVMNAPRRKTARDALAKDIAARLHQAPSPDSLAPVIQYEKDIVLLRSLVLNQRRSAIAKASERNDRFNWIKRIGKQGPWDQFADPLSLEGAPALPMPVEQSDKESLAPFFAHLAGDGTHEPTSAKEGHGGFTTGAEPYYNTELIEFEKGVLYSDGRIDLCKMGTGPRNIGDLMQSLKGNTFSKHFLLGNNIIGPTGAQAIADFIHEFPKKFETWYLAGNCIDGTSFRKLVDAMVASPAITNVWLKRNPLGPGAAKDVFRLITQTPNLRTLDLDETELGDEGVAELFGLLAGWDGTASLPLCNIYLNACGIGEKACKEIARWIGSSACPLESLYMSNNPVGDAVTELAAGLKDNTALRRLSVQSCGLKDSGVIALANAIANHPSLTVLDIGQAYATEDLGMRYNWLTDTCVPALVDLINTNSKVLYLNLSYTALTQSGLNSLLAAVSTSPSLLWFQAKISTAGGKGGRDAEAVKAGQEGARLYKLARERLHANVAKAYGGMEYVRFENEERRFLVSPRDVRFIDSVYRNRDAGAARRGEKRLVKWWEEGDETLARVAEGSLE